MKCMFTAPSLPTLQNGQRNYIIMKTIFYLINFIQFEIRFEIFTKIYKKNKNILFEFTPLVKYEQGTHGNIETLMVLISRAVNKNINNSSLAGDRTDEPSIVYVNKHLTALASRCSADHGAYTHHGRYS